MIAGTFKLTPGKTPFSSNLFSRCPSGRLIANFRLTNPMTRKDDTLFLSEKHIAKTNQRKVKQ